METPILNLRIEVNCPICNSKIYILVNKQDYINWKNGTLAQLAFPYLSADKREGLLSGLCNKCFNKMMSE